MELSEVKRDRAKIEAGDWVDDIPGFADVRLKVRGLTAPTAVSLRARKERAAPKKARERDNAIKPEYGLIILGEVLAEFVLIDWEGFTENGQPVPYSQELAHSMLTNPGEFMPLIDAVTWAAGIIDRGLNELSEETAKNLKRRSPGPSDTTEEKSAA